MNIGDKVQLQYYYGDKEIINGTIVRYLDGDLDGGGYWIRADNGEEWDVLFCDLFRKSATLKYIS